jgi:hypothetical protein
MMPIDSYRLYQVERVKSGAEVRYADEQLGRLAATVSGRFQAIARPAPARRRPRPAGRRSRMARVLQRPSGAC